MSQTLRKDVLRDFFSVFIFVFRLGFSSTFFKILFEVDRWSLAPPQVQLDHRLQFLSYLQTAKSLNSNLTQWFLFLEDSICPPCTACTGDGRLLPYSISRQLLLYLELFFLRTEITTMAFLPSFHWDHITRFACYLWVSRTTSFLKQYFWCPSLVLKNTFLPPPHVSFTH